MDSLHLLLNYTAGPLGPTKIQ